MAMINWLVNALVALLLAAGQAPPSAAAATRFDYLVRADFFAGLAGDEARLQKMMDLCERTLADSPRHPEALVWHGAGTMARAAAAFRAGDAPNGRRLFDVALKEMDDAVALAPDKPGVLIPRAAVLFEATRGMPADVARPLLESAVANYARVLDVQAPGWTGLSDHAKGELLFGLAEGSARLGRADAARMYFDRLVADAPSSGQAPRARQWLATGTIPKSDGPSCVGCHK